MNYDDVIKRVAFCYEIEPVWVKAIIQRESAGNPLALRYEPHYVWLYYPELITKSSTLITLDTETVTQKMSWGLCQIMGALAREQGLTGPMAQLLDPEINITHCCKRLKWLKGRSDHKDDVFAMYNGGPGAMNKGEGTYKNQKYVDGVNYYVSLYS